MKDSISYSDILASLAALEKVGIVPRPRDPFPFLDMPVHIHEECRQPRMQLSAKIMEILDPVFASEMNAWMADFFGVDDHIYMISGMWGPMVLASPQSVVKLTNCA